MELSNDIQNWINDIERQLSPMVTPEELVEIGLFPSKYSLAQRRLRGQGPEYIKLGSRQIFYPKNAVMSWLNICARDSNRSKCRNTDE